MARLRENAEPVAMLGGEKVERHDLLSRYRGVYDNTFAIMRRQKLLTFMTAGYQQFSVIAPFDGGVTELNAKTGNSINAGEIAVTLANISKWTVITTDVNEIAVVNCVDGQPVTVKLDAVPDAELNGEILSIGQGYTENQCDIVYEVTIILTDQDPTMRWGITTVVTFK